jgi:transcriptional regulator with XRE-family HTH domain
MPAKHKVDNRENLIWKLRQQLGVTQDKLEKWLGMSGGEIRDLENGKKKIKGRVFRRILDTIAAEYSVRSEAWLDALSRRRCSWGTVYRYQRQSSKPEQRRRDCESLICRIAVLFRCASAEEYNALRAKFSEFVETYLKDHPSLEAEEIFKRSAPIVISTRKQASSDYENEEQSVAEELRLPVMGMRKNTSAEITRTYKDFPAAAKLLPKAKQRHQKKFDRPIRPSDEFLVEKAVEALQAVTESEPPSAKETMGEKLKQDLMQLGKLSPIASKLPEQKRRSSMQRPPAV